MLVGLAFTSPWLIGFVVFALGPVIASAYLSLTDYPLMRAPVFVGLGNYTELLGDEKFWRYAVLNTLFMFLEIPVAIGVAIALAMLLNQRLRGITLYRTLFFLPSIVPAVATAMLWRWIFNSEYGLLNAGLNSIGLPSIGWLTDPRWSKPSFILMDVWGAGGAMVIYLASLQGVPEHLYEAAHLDGAGWWSRTRFVTLPMLSPVILFSVITGVIGTFQYFTQAFIMTRGGPELSTLFYALYLFDNAFQYFKMGYACALAWVLFVITLICTLIVFRSSAKWVYYEGN